VIYFQQVILEVSKICSLGFNHYRMGKINKMFITHDDSKIFATAFGSKESPAILALGGWIGSWEDWIEPLSILSEDWRVISYDHRGCGVTISSVEDITFDRLVDDVFLVLDAYGVEQCVLAAMSMGALIALGAALRQPDRITALVLVDSLDMREQPSNTNDKFLMGLTHDYSRALDGFINACVPEENCDHIKRWGRHILDRATQESALELYKLSKRVPIRDELHNLLQPTLLIHGDADLIAPVESAQWLAKQIPNAELQIIRGAGHVPILTRPEEVVRHIQHFFSNR
jgi:pimeloyl-ACP methyl ester carboxylesterase